MTARRRTVWPLPAGRVSRERTSSGEEHTAKQTQPAIDYCTSRGGATRSKQEQVPCLCEELP